MNKTLLAYWSVVLVTALFCSLAPSFEAVSHAAIGPWSLGVVVVAFALAAFLWNRKLAAPSGGRAWFLLAAAAFSSACGLYWQSTEFQLLTAALLVGHCLSSHSRRRLVSLDTFAVPGIIVGLAVIPFVATVVMNHAVAMAEGGTVGLLRLFQIPHALDGHRLLSQYVNEDFQFTLSGLGSPVLCAVICATVMAFFKRCWMHVCLGSAVAYYLAVAFHSGVPAMQAYAFKHDWPYFVNLAPGICLIVVLMVFMSADRLLEAVFTPVAPDDNASAANPPVHYWNMFVSPKTTGKRIASPGLSRLLPAGLTCIIAALPAALALPGVLASFSNRGARAADFEATEFASVFNDAMRVDHASGNLLAVPMLGTVYDQWQIECPEYDCRIIVCQSGDAERYDERIWSEQGRADEPGKPPEVGDFVAPKPLLPIESSERVEVTRLFETDGQREQLLLESKATKAGWQVKLLAQMPFGTNPRLERVLLRRFQDLLETVDAEESPLASKSVNANRVLAVAGGVE